MSTTSRRFDEEPPAGTRAAIAAHVGATLRAGEALGDNTFDDLFPLPIRAMSRVSWTPVKVARRAAQLLVQTPQCRVLDVGSGAGKFCVIAGLSTQGSIFGVEQEESLVECARDIAMVAGAQNVKFMHGLFHALDPGDYDAFYFFNPFEEGSLWSPSSSLRASQTPLERFAGDVHKARRFLRAARLGARVVTYNGMGGRLPSCYQLLKREPVGCGIELWAKAS